MSSKNERDELVSLLQYMKNSTLSNPEITVLDERICKLDAIVTEVKQSEEWEDAQMSILSTGIDIGRRVGHEEGLEKGRKEGRKEGQLEGIHAIITVLKNTTLPIQLLSSNYVTLSIWIQTLRKECFMISHAMINL